MNTCTDLYVEILTNKIKLLEEKMEDIDKRLEQAETIISILKMASGIQTKEEAVTLLETFKQACIELEDFIKKGTE
jgi:hypothetical protein